VGTDKRKAQNQVLTQRGAATEMEHRDLTTSTGESVIVFSPSGRLDITTAWKFRLKLQEAITQDSPNILVNLEQVNFIDSSGLTSLVAGMRDTEKIGGSFRLCNVHSEARLVFEVTMMDSVFEIYSTEAEALAVPFKVAVG